MKRFWLFAAVALVLLTTGPAFAIQADFSGEYKVEGIYNNHLSLEDDGTGSDAYMKMRLRIKSVFEISDKISLTARLDGLDKRWGDSDESKATSDSEFLDTSVSSPASAIPYVRTSTTVENESNIDLEWAYMTIKTGIGGFMVGRQKGNVWGLTFGDTEGPRDRITYVLPIQNTIIAALYEKMNELDGNDLTKTDADIDKYYLTVTQKGENFKAGFLYGYYNYKTFQNIWQNRQTAWLLGVADAGGNIYTGIDRPYLMCEAAAHIIMPYFDGKFGNFGIKAELNYALGKIKYDEPYRVTPTDAQLSATTLTGGIANSDGDDTKEAEGLACNAELSYDLDRFTFKAGYAYSSGDADYNDNKSTSFGYIEAGEDWEKFAILNGANHGTNAMLGGLGNLAGGGLATFHGFKMYYLEAHYRINDTMNIGLLYGKSQADDVPEYDASRATVYATMQSQIPDSKDPNLDWDDDHGSEYDLTFEWQILPNLKYHAILAYLDAGDYWQQGDDSVNVKDNYLVWSRLTVEF
ncbi:MAG: hypothetical protein GY874_15775 [Desulfobacteraceae bacterium]|nr:hypothetical protein [Desulfobacteraceae bacterium]